MWTLGSMMLWVALLQYHLTTYGKLSCFGKIAGNVVDRVFAVNLCWFLGIFREIFDHVACKLVECPSDVQSAEWTGITSIREQIYRILLSSQPVWVFRLMWRIWKICRHVFPWMQEKWWTIRRHFGSPLFLIVRHGFCSGWEDVASTQHLSWQL